MGGDSYNDIGKEQLSNVKQRKDDLFIIGAGFPRTGTSSLQIALAKLGFKCHHMREIFKDQSLYQWNQWYNVGKMKYDLKINNNIQSFKVKDNWDKCTIDYDWKKIFDHKETYNGCLDFPSSSFYVELMKYYPNYRVILSVRDNADQWYQSMFTTVWQIVIVNRSSWFFQLLAWITGQNKDFVYHTSFGLLFDGYQKFEDKQHAMKVYDEWIEAVKEYVPKDRLLVFNVKQGWKPLCDFLGKEMIDNEPFPRANDKENIKKIANTMKRVQTITDLIAIGAIVGASYLVYKKWFSS